MSASATIIGHIDLKPAAPKAKKPASGLPTCEGGNKTFEDVTLSECRNGSYVCGFCGQRFVVGPKDGSIQLPVHRITPELHELRKKYDRDERAAKRQHRAN